MGQLITLGGLSLPNAETQEAAVPRARDASGDPHRQRRARANSAAAPACTTNARSSCPTEHSIRGEGTGLPTGFGVNGGGFGAGGSFEVQEANEDWRAVPRYGVERSRPMRIRIASAGGGGYGDPRRRDPDLVRRDIADGIVSAEAAREIYGVTP